MLPLQLSVSSPCRHFSTSKNVPTSPGTTITSLVTEVTTLAPPTTHFPTTSHQPSFNCTFKTSISQQIQLTRSVQRKLNNSFCPCGTLHKYDQPRRPGGTNLRRSGHNKPPDPPPRGAPQILGVVFSIICYPRDRITARWATFDLTVNLNSYIKRSSFLPR